MWNFLLWTQQVEGVITSPKLHRFVVNPEISMKYDLETDREIDVVSEAYDKWLTQDQLFFTWFLSTLSESALSEVVGCCHAF